MRKKVKTASRSQRDALVPKAHPGKAGGAEQVELLRLDAKSIRVSEYLTELPPMKLLQTRLHQAIEHAKEQVLRRREYNETADDDTAPRGLERKVEKLPEKQK